MSISVPQLDIYYIELTKKDYETIDNGDYKAVTCSVELGKGKVAGGIVAGGGAAAVALATLLAPSAGILGLAMLPLMKMGISLTPDIVKSLKRLVKENRFYIIRSMEELSEFENAMGNEWVINNKSLKHKQYYIRHPKKESRNLLIEAKNFYNYIEEEQKDELINFIMSHCPVKSIKIDSTEIVENNGKVNGSVKSAELNGEVNFGKVRGNYYNYNNPNGAPKVQPRENYFWLPKPIMNSIAALTEGASLEDEILRDFTFGLTAGEVKTLGIDLGKHKKFSYKIQIVC